MSINPSDYDLDELRRMARERGSRSGERDVGLDVESIEAGERGGGGSFRAGLYRELLPLEAGSGDTSKPYLPALPESEAAEYLVFEWLEFLLLHAGYQGAVEALEYYESIEWITDEVRSDLGDYLLGLDDVAASDGTDLDVDDHLLSLVYVAKLASMR